jgi:hypothetical protein
MGADITSDHDLLVRIDTKLDIYTARQNDHETRIRRLEQLGIVTGLLIMLGQGALWYTKFHPN